MQTVPPLPPVPGSRPAGQGEAGAASVADAGSEPAKQVSGSSLASDVLATRNQLILDELPQVYFIAARLLERLPASVQIEDLVHAGVLGLLEAYEKFDSSRNAQFKTFARFRIKGAILDSLRLLDWGSRSMRRKGREIREAAQRLEHSLQRQPSKEEIAAEMKVPLAELETVLSQIDGLQIVSQFAAVAGDSGEVQDLIENAPSLAASPFDLCLKREQKQHLAQAIAALNEREQLVLALYYQEELTMKEVAQVVGIALSRVSQIHNAAVGKLRASMAALQAPPAAMVAAGARGRAARPQGVRQS